MKTIWHLKYNDPDLVCCLEYHLFMAYLYRMQGIIIRWKLTGQCTFCTIISEVSSFVDNPVYCILYIVYCILYIVYCILYIVYCILYTTSRCKVRPIKACQQYLEMCTCMCWPETKKISRWSMPQLFLKTPLTSLLFAT